jgi:glyoxylase-like metal-dependent hydrolase (beta-lactamase superfamily II)
MGQPVDDRLAETSAARDTYAHAHRRPAPASISDGTFVARPTYFGSHVAPDAHPELFGRHGTAWLPLGCFLIRSGERVILVDAGLGPEAQEIHGGMHLLVGGRRLTGLRAYGVTTSEVTDVVSSHLHADHVGWLFDLPANPIFRATIWYGAGDFHHFVTGPGAISVHIRQGFTAPGNQTRLRPIDRDTTVASGISALLAPGHTPGHLCVVVSSGQDRALLLGDAVTCPVQLDEPTWHSLGDVDPALADRSRERLLRKLENDHTIGAGSHFPELRFGRVLPGTARRWLS